MRTRVTVERNALKFAAAHMATFAGRVEPLHGHNYAVLVECEGPLTEDGWVVDFGHVKQVMKRLCDGLDHKFLLQRPSALLSGVLDGQSWVLTAEGSRRYVFPASDVLALPIGNSTAEQIAGWLHGRLCEELRAIGVMTIETVTVGVEEAPGQAGWYTSGFAGGDGRDTVRVPHAAPDTGTRADGECDAD